MRLMLVLLLTLISFSVFGADPCEKCDKHQIQIARENMTQLNFEMVEDFLCTFDDSCASDLEFYRMSNETLFDLVYNAPDLFLTVLQFGQLKNHRVILDQLKTPVHVGIDVVAVRNKVKNTDETHMYRNDVLSALD